MKHGRQSLHMRYLIYGCAYFKNPDLNGEIPPPSEYHLEDFADIGFTDDVHEIAFTSFEVSLLLSWAKTTETALDQNLDPEDIALGRRLVALFPGEDLLPLPRGFQ